MHSRLFFTIVLLGLVALATAAPRQIQKRSSFKVERVRNAKFTGRNGPRALAKAFKKYHMELPQGLKDALAAQKAAKEAARLARRHHHGGGPHDDNNNNNNAGDLAGALADALGSNGNDNSDNTPSNNTAGTGTVTATPEANDVEYLAPVSIGGQTLNLDFDTGSSDLWVFNTELSKADTAGHSVFDPTTSKTFSLIKGAEFNISYGDGSSASGLVGTDVVNLGGASFDKQAVELATDVSASFIEDQDNDGLLGLAFSSINTVQPQQQKTFFANIQDSLPEPVFTANLKHDAVGAYEFGAIDSTSFNGALTWVDIDNTNGFWQFSTSSFSVGNGKSQAITAGAQAIADTGTTLLITDPTVVEGYYSQVQGAAVDEQQGGVVFPCDATLPNLNLDIGGYTATIAGKLLNFAQVSDNECYGALQATSAGSLGVYGDILFKAQFIAFNGANNSIGLAPHA